MKRIFYVLLLSSILFISCSSVQPVQTAATHEYPTECLGISYDGSQTLRVYASGLTRRQAIKYAKRKAINDVLFTGITAGAADCNSYPIVDTPNARTTHAEYFDDFFSGTYSKYVSYYKFKYSTKKQYNGDGTTLMGLIVIVDRSALKKRMQKDEIIK